MTKHNATDATDIHDAELQMLANGDATMAEVARLAGVSRQAVAKWARAAGIDPVEARKARLERLWAARPQGNGPFLTVNEAVAIARGRPVPKRKRLK